MQDKEKLEKRVKKLQERVEMLEESLGTADHAIQSLQNYNKMLKAALEGDDNKYNAELEEENRKLQNQLSQTGAALSRVLEENEALKKLKNVHTHNERNAGRKKDTHLEVYLLGCWAKEMTDQEIIGTEYDSFYGKKKVSRASYYRAKKRLRGNEKNEDTEV